MSRASKASCTGMPNSVMILVFLPVAPSWLRKFPEENKLSDRPGPYAAARRRPRACQSQSRCREALDLGELSKLSHVVSWILARLGFQLSQPPSFRSELERRGHWCIILSKGKIQVGNCRTRCTVRTEGIGAVRARTHEEQCGGQLLPSGNPSIIFLLIQ